MPSTVTNIGTGESVRITSTDLQNLRALKNNADLTEEKLTEINRLLEERNETLRATSEEYTKILEILKEARDVTEQLFWTNEGELNLAQQLTALSKIIGENLDQLQGKSRGFYKDLTSSTYKLRTLTEGLAAIRLGGDPLRLKDFDKFQKRAEEIKGVLANRSFTLGIDTNNISAELERFKQTRDDLLGIRSGQIAFRDLSADRQQRLRDVGAIERRRVAGVFRDVRNFENIEKSLAEIAKKLVNADVLESAERYLEELSNERTVTERVDKVTGAEYNRSKNYQTLARRFGLYSVANSLDERTRRAYQEAKKEAGTVKDGKEGDSVILARYKEVLDLDSVFKDVKNTVVETYLHLGKWGGPLGAALALGIAIFRQLLQFDKQAVETKRVIGQWADASAVANFSFVSGTEVLKTMVQLGQQFKINPVQVFSPEELGNIARAQKFTGMTAEAAGNLAVQSKISGQNANTYRDAIAKGASQANALNHSAVSLSAVQNDVLQTSRAIALSYGNHTAELSRAAGAAASLGMNLQQVEDISKNLMNFESSIQAEMQAQLLTGMQLNLAKAREYALNNDLEGVTREISRQGMNAAKFSHMNYIQQENMAKALGMSREQMSKMLIMQELNSGLSAKQVAAMTNMRKEDIEALSVQEKWQTMKQKFLESLVPLLEPVLQITSDILRLLTPFVGAIGWVAKQISTFGGLIKEDNLLLRAIPTILTIALVAGLKFAGVFATIGKLTTKIGRGILSWIPGLGKARVAAQATDVIFDKTANRWRNVTTGRFVKAPLAQQATVQGPSRIGKLFSSLGKNATNILTGAAAAVIMSGAVWVLAKAAQEFGKIDKEAMARAAMGIVLLTGAITALGFLMSSVVGAGAVLAGAAAMVVVAGSVFILGKAVQQLTAVPGDELQSIASGIRSIAGAVAELAGKLEGLSVRKLNALGKAFKRLGGAQVQVSTFENTGESQEIRRDSLAATAQTITIQQAQVQAKSQQISVEQKATDLSEIRKDIQAVKDAVLRSRPTWNWLEFNHQAALNGFVVQ